MHQQPMLPRLSMIGDREDFSYFQSLQYPTVSPISTSSSSLSGLMQCGSQPPIQQQHNNYSTNHSNCNSSSNSGYNNGHGILTPASSSSSTNSIVATSSQHDVVSSSTNNNHMNNEQEHATVDTSPNFHPIACEQCRKVHKFCTKVLPICDRCSEKGIACEYKTPKRMRYHKNNQQQNAKKSKPSSALVLPQKAPQKLSKKEVIEYFYSFNMENGTIDRKMLEDNILQRSDKKEIQALFYAIKGVVEQRLGIATSEASIKKSRDLLGPFFDNVVDNFHVACTYSYLASYESGSGKRSLCKFYIGAAKCYVDGKKDEELNEHELAFKKGLFMMDIFLSNNEFCLSMLVKDFPKIFEYFTQEKLPPEISRALQQPITPDNYHEHLRLFEVVGTFIRKHIACKDKDEDSDETRAKATELFKSIISNGVKISLLTKAGYGDCTTVEEAALKITLLTEQDLFSYFSVVVLTYIAMATRVHLRIVNKIEQGLRQNLLTGVTLDNSIVPIDYYQILEKDYKALKAMGKKYKKVEIDYNSIMTEIEEILHKRQESCLQNLKTTPSNSSLESPTTACESDSFDPFLSNEDMLQMFLQGASFQF